jgi:hypothetical protein
MTFHPFGSTIGNLPSPLPVANGGTGLTTSPITPPLGGSGLTTDPDPPWVPADGGWLSQNYDPVNATSTQITTAGTIYLMRFNIRYNMTVTNVVMCLTTASSGASSTSFTGLYSSAGTLLSGSSDILTITNGATGFKTLPLTTPQPVTAGTFVWAAILTNASVTQPTFARTTSSNTAYESGTAAAGFRFAVNGTVQSSLPTLTPASNTVTGSFAFWAALS